MRHKLLGRLGLGLKSQEFWLSRSRPMRHKSLGLLGLGQKSLGQSRDFELWDVREIFYVYL